jgi:2-C-methyl-D-erythritol 4-phosphate cytidylyltransferase
MGGFGQAAKSAAILGCGPPAATIRGMQIGTLPRCFALVPCAGVGLRAGAGGPKQYQTVAGRAMVAHTLAALAQVARIEATLVVLSPGDGQFQTAAPDHVGERAWVAHCGGATRAESVASGLLELQARGVQPHDWVLVHDAARCLLQPLWVDRLIDACLDDEVGGLLALPLADTLKQAERGRVSSTVDRTGKWAAQTPQMFRAGLLLPALRMAGDAVTDESSAIEAFGHAPKLILGDLANLKVTWPEDFVLAERLMKGLNGIP